jgi:hypothetical protein
MFLEEKEEKNPQGEEHCPEDFKLIKAVNKTSRPTPEKKTESYPHAESTI